MNPSRLAARVDGHGVRQILGAVLLAAATYGVLLRIAEAKVETSVGGGDFPLCGTIWIAPARVDLPGPRLPGAER